MYYLYIDSNSYELYIIYITNDLLVEADRSTTLCPLIKAFHSWNLVKDKSLSVGSSIIIYI